MARIRRNKNNNKYFDIIPKNTDGKNFKFKDCEKCGFKIANANGVCTRCNTNYHDYKKE